MEDNEILELFYQHDEHALQEIASKYGAKLKRFAMHFLGNEPDAEECLNDVYFKAWNAIPIRKPEHLSAYLMQICRYTAFSMIDRQSAQKRNAVLVELTNEMEQCIPDVSAPEQQTELSELLSEFLKTLSKEKRILFVRRYWYGDSIREIAEAFHWQESRVKTNLFRIRKKLELFLKRKGFFI
ncbi:MAG: RNA polymerase sigma factor [Oscillospiraceae bacterium]|nr:RNA polymerase sigma factor [Oscillospiraceae bacterium]